jgi:sodium-dependent dicarboxylate transporter 2/3/5
MRQRAGAVLAVAAFLLLWFLPLPALKPEAHRLAAVLGLVVVLWVSEALPLSATALLGAALCVILGVAPAKTVFAPFADPLIFLFIGAFILSRGIFIHHLDRRVAFAVLSLPWIGARPDRILLALGAVTASISAWISNTATTAMMFGIGMAIIATLRQSEGGAAIDDRYPSALMLMISYAASIGGLATPVGTPPNVIGIGFIRSLVGEEIPFFQWMLVGVPVVLVLYTLLYFYLRAVAPAGLAELPGSREMIRAERARLGPWTAGERSVALAFGLTVLLWVAPGVAALIGGETGEAYKVLTARMPEGVAAVIGALLLFVLPGEEGRAMTWDEAMRIDWGVVLLYGGGFALGVLSFETGLADALGRGVAGLIPFGGSFGLLVASVLMAVLLSETTSNTASANMVVPVVISISRAAGVDPVEPALAATMAASLGFMLPVSTPCNAIVYGSGYIPLGRMIRWGLALDLAGIVVIIVMIRLLVPFVR